MARANVEVARLLDELAVLTELDEGTPQAFRVRAYQNAQRAVEGLERDVGEMSLAELAAVRGLGKSTAAKIREFSDTGAIAKLDELRAKHPAGKLALMKVPGLGPRSVELLASELGVQDLDALVAALDDGRIAELPGMGERTAENLRRGIDELELTSKARRAHLFEALPVAERIVAALREVVGDGEGEVAYAGSLRRFAATIGDVDVLVATDDPEPVTTAFLALDDVERIIGSGATKTSIVTRAGVQVDLRIVPRASFGAALIYFTGSKAHNIRLRQRALVRGWTLNEYALAELPPEAGESDLSGSDADEPDEAAEPPPPARVVASYTEADVYTALGLSVVAAEQREDHGEIETAETGDGATLVEVEDLRGDLHDHTDLSGDGRATLEAMVAAAADRGLDYLAITDHAEDLTMNGVSRAGMLAQRRQLRELEQRRGDLRLLHGAELNVGADGTLDYDDAFLADFDWLVASVHSHFGRGVEAQTVRLVTAIRHPSVTAIGHLTGRMLGKRPGIELDVEAVLDAAAETGTAIEINASPRRLDASVEVLREGARRGVAFVVSTDAHATDELERARFGAAHARRAGLDRARIANTWEPGRFLAWIDEVRGR